MPRRHREPIAERERKRVGGDPRLVGHLQKHRRQSSIPTCSLYDQGDVTACWWASGYASRGRLRAPRHRGAGAPSGGRERDSAAHRAARRRGLPGHVRTSRRSRGRARVIRPAGRGYRRADPKGARSSRRSRRGGSRGACPRSATTTAALAAHGRSSRRRPRPADVAARHLDLAHT